MKLDKEPNIIHPSCMHSCTHILICTYSPFPQSGTLMHVERLMLVKTDWSVIFRKALVAFLKYWAYIGYFPF